ncbi:hypothetical protein [Roseibium sp.]
MSDTDMVPARFVPKKALNRGVFVVIAMGALVVWGANSKVIEMNSEEIPVNLMTVLGTAAALALLLERAVEVLLSVICGPQEIANKTRETAFRAAQSAKLAHERAILESLATPDERIAFLSRGGGSRDASTPDPFSPDAIRASSEDVAQLKITKQYLSTLMLTILGGALSAGGFRILAQVFGTGEPGADPLTSALTVLDIVVSTLVLGGGAQGIHDLISRLNPSDQ